MSYRPHPTKGHNWWYIVVSQGTKKKPLYFPYYGDESEVMSEDKRLNALIKGERMTVEATIAETLPSYTTYYKTIATPAVVKDMLSIMKRCILPHFGRLAPRQIVAPLVYRYHSERLESGVTHRTVEKECNFLSAMVKWMKKTGITDKINDIPRPQKAKCKPQKVMMPMTLDELSKFISFLPADHVPLALLMSDAGLRCQESLRIRCEDIDLAGWRIFVRGKGNKKLMYPIITKRLFDALEKAKAGRPSGWLVVNPKTGLEPDTEAEPYKSFKRSFSTAARRAGILKPVTHHVLRHTYSTLLMELEIPAEVRRQLMRHSSLATTEHYTHVSPEWLEKQAGRFADLIDNLQEIVETPSITQQLKTDSKRPSHLRLVK